MRVERNGEVTTLTLTDAEVKLLRRVFERASFIDTPIREQPEIASFASRSLEDLPTSD